MERENWTGKIGFIAACVGSAVGLGNLWLFPWRLGELGGASFLIPYLIFVFGFVRFGVMSEIAFGRSQQRETIGCFENAFKGNPAGKFLGLMPVLALSALLSFYSIVVGWILKYLFNATVYGFSGQNSGEQFGRFIGTSASVPWHVLAMVFIIGISILGITKGVEKSNKIFMPLFFLMLLVLLVRSVTLPGAFDGIAFLFQTDWDKLFEIKTWVMALGQSFFTVSMGGMLVYGSYLSSDVDIPDSTTKVVIFNTIASLTAALVIIPSVFAFNLDIASGPKLMFITLPSLFAEMPAGRFFGIVFFICALLAGLSSAINMLELSVSALAEYFSLSRVKATLIAGSLIYLSGVPLSLSMNLFGHWADIVTVYFYPVTILLIQIAFLWFFGADRAIDEINRGSSRKYGTKMKIFLKYIFPAVAFSVIILSILYGGIG